MISDLLQDWQREVLKKIQDAKRSICMISRQAGKSFLAAYLAVQKAIIDRSTWICISTGERQSQEWLKKALKLAKYMTHNLRGTPLYCSYQYNASEIRFSNGGRVLAVPCNPDTLRGFSGNVIADEMAFWENDQEVWRAIIPFLTSKFGGEKQIMIISTPAGKSGLFYDLWSKDNDFLKVKKTVFDVGKTEEEIEELRKNCVDDDIFKSEYCCEFLDSASSLFGFDLLRSCIWDVLEDGVCFGGLDIGRKNDLTALAIILRTITGKKYVREILTFKDLEFSAQIQKISDAIEALKIKKLCIDSTGIGMQMAEELKKKYPHVVIPYQFTNQSKNDLFGELKKEMGLGNLLIPDDRQVIDELHSIKRNLSPSGNISYSADRTNGSHADRATAIALANKAVGKKLKSFDPFRLVERK